jgi:hypothetical protein
MSISGWGSEITKPPALDKLLCTTKADQRRVGVVAQGLFFACANFNAFLVQPVEQPDDGASTCPQKIAGSMALAQLIRSWRCNSRSMILAMLQTQAAALLSHQRQCIRKA